MKALVLTLAIAAPAVALAEIADIKWDKGAFAHVSKIAPKKFVEVCGKLAKGERVDWKFKSDGAVNFNIHYHVGKDVSYPEQRNAVDKGEGTLEVALDQDYCWMWSNKGGAEVVLELKLQKH